MNKIISAFILIVIIGAAAMSGILSQESRPNTQGPAAITKCVDFDPPSTSEKISFGGASYGLIKKDAQIKEDFKFAEMKKIGEIDGRGLYNMGASNYFGESISADVVFLLKNTTLASPYIFDIYIKDGIPIPDVIKNCKSTGGELTLVIDDPEAFPPYAFNKTDIKNLSDDTIAPAFVYNSNKTTTEFVNSLSGVKNIGSLYVASKNKDFPIMAHLGTAYLIDDSFAYEYLPSDNPIDIKKTTKKSIQLKKIVFVTTPTYSWFTPSCKPAIYLYPEKRENVNVAIKTKGRFTLTIPSYPASGWNVVANPDGRIEYKDSLYPYLYYESEIPTAYVARPEKGFVVKFDQLPAFFDNILVNLGLNKKEAAEFKEYWEKVLPKSAYYFIGVMDEEDINSLEPLSINPAPETLIRVRLYFEAQDAPIKVAGPVITSKKRIGFTAVEWGGMIKLEKDSSFTCSQ